MNKLKELRESSGMRQDEIATIIGTSLANYNKKENGEVRVSLIEAKKIADLFHMTIEDIFFTK